MARAAGLSGVLPVRGQGRAARARAPGAMRLAGDRPAVSPAARS